LQGIMFSVEVFFFFCLFLFFSFFNVRHGSNIFSNKNIDRKDRQNFYLTELDNLSHNILTVRLDIWIPENTDSWVRTFYLHNTNIMASHFNHDYDIYYPISDQLLFDVTILPTTSDETSLQSHNNNTFTEI
jgi:hypothetical protein